MKTRQFISLKWQILGIAGGLSFLMLVAILGYWQFAVDRLAQMNRDEDRRNMEQVIDTVYLQWRLRTIESAKIFAMNSDLRRMMQTGFDDHDSTEVERVLQEYMLAMNADFVSVTDSSFRVVSTATQDRQPFAAPRNAKMGDMTFEVVCRGAALCWEVIVFPVIKQGRLIGEVLVAIPVSDYLKTINGKYIAGHLAIVQKSTSLKEGDVVFESQSLLLPNDYHLTGKLVAHGNLNVIQSALRITGIGGGIIFVATQALLVYFLFRRVSYIKKLESGLEMLLGGHTEVLKSYLDRGGNAVIVDELDNMGGAMVKTGEKLSDLRENETKAAEDRARLKTAEYIAEERKALLAKLAKSQEEMRHALARELHDEVGARLISMKVDLTKIKSSPDISEAILKRVNRIERNILVLTNFLHNTIEGLSPTVVGDFGLAGSIRGLVEEWSAGLTGITEFHLTLQGDLHSVPFAESTAAYRVVQETITNITKHASAKNVYISVVQKNTQDLGDTLVIEIKDDGKGFDTSAKPKSGGRGLQGIRDRVSAFGGAVRIKSRPGKGSEICCLLPLKASQPLPPV